MADNTNTPDNDGWSSPEEKFIYDEFLRQQRADREQQRIKRTTQAWERGERSPDTIELDPIIPKELDVRQPAPPTPSKKPGVFSNIDAFIKGGKPKTSAPITKSATVSRDDRVVKTGTGGEVSTGYGGKLRTRAPDEFSNDPQSYYKRMMGLRETDDKDMSELLHLSGYLNEKAVSKQQQKFMGMVHAMQKGETVKGASPELKKVAKTMSKKDAKDFASTKHKDLPKKVTEDIMLDEGGNALKHITNRFKHEVKSFMNSGYMDDDLFDALYDYYSDTGEMPYGVAKARTGDPHQWIEERFYQDMGSGMSEGAGMDLTELARLAGLKTEGVGDTIAQVAGNVVGSTVKGAQNLAKGAGEMVDQFKMGKTDAEIGRKSFAVPTPDVEVKKAEPYIGFGENIPRLKPETPTATPWLNECGDMGMNNEQQSSMNVSTNMSSDGTKNVTISAAGDQAEALIQMLKLAGMGHNHVSQNEPDVVMIGSNEEELEEAHDNGIQVHNFVGMPARDIYDETQTNDAIKDGDVLVTETGVGVMVSAWPVTVAGNIEGFHKLKDGVSWEEFEGGKYSASAQKAMEEAGKLDEAFANEPEEEYHTIASIIRQGNDLNREKRQYASKPRLGDNPMAEEIIDEELANLLDSVLVRETHDDMVGFVLETERAYQAVIDRFGHVIEHDEDSGIMYTPQKFWGRIQEVAYDADGIGAEESNGYENPEHYGLSENEYGEEGDRGFFVAIGSEDEGAFVGMVAPEGGKWRERPIAGKAPSNWGQQYMGYLEPRDVMQWIEKDYGSHAHVAGPFFDEDEAMDYARNYFDMGAGDDYDDEEDLEEGLFDTDADLQARSPQYKALKAMEPKYKGTQYEPQLKQRIGAAQARAASDAGEVMDLDTKTGRQVPRPVVPPEQYKAK